MSNVIDLSQLPAPDIVETLDYEAIRQSMIGQLTTEHPDYELAESDPAIKVLEVAAYREMILRQRINEAARAVMLPYAEEDDLDNLAAFYNVARQVIDRGDPQATPPVPPTYEPDPVFRNRILLSLDGLSVAGPAGAYIFHALSASGQVLDASAASPAPGDVIVTVLAHAGDGSADQPLLDTVAAAVNADDVRPLTDNVSVQSATIIDYQVTATLYTYDGPDSSVVMTNARTAIEAYTDAMHRLGHDITLSGVYNALHVAGTQRVDLASPGVTIDVDDQHAAYCTAITLTYGGTDE